MVKEGILEENKCLFCDIGNGRIKQKKVYEDDAFAVINDINPQAPTHFLIFPKEHIPTLYDLTPENAHLVGNAYLLAKKLAEQAGIGQSGYRIVANCKENGGQTLYHIHFHFLGGRFMKWPPG